MTTCEILPTMVNGTTFFQPMKFPYIGYTAVSPSGHDYALVKLLGKGSFGSTYEVAHHSGRLFAMKIMDLGTKSTEKESRKEINNHVMLRSYGAYDSPLMQFIDYFRVENKLCIVMEKLECTVFERTSNLKIQVPMEELRVVTHQILRGVARIHGLGFVHTDLKPDNVMFCGRERPLDVKIIDFGLLVKTEVLQRYYNMMFMARSYRAPEVFLGLPLSEKVDIWSVGVILFELYMGMAMFTGNTDADTMYQISSTFGLHYEAQYGSLYNHFYSFNPHIGHAPRSQMTCLNGVNSSIFQNLTQYGFNARHLGSIQPVDTLFHDLLNRLLAVDSRYRISAEAALRHSFFAGLSY